MKIQHRISSLVFGSALALSFLSAHAYNTNAQVVEANVISAQPVYTVVQVNNPQQQCWQEAISVPQQTYETRTPEILGAIVGAGVGRLFGSGRGQDVATVAGAVLGGSIGRDQNNKRSQANAGVRYEQRCKSVDNYRSEERLEGYDVTYEYNGAVYNTRTQSDPGQTITLSVNVVPIEY